jgi:hypothetical protein
VDAVELTLLDVMLMVQVWKTVLGQQQLARLRIPREKRTIASRRIF